MSPGFVFYFLGGLVLASAGLAVTRRNSSHTVAFFAVASLASAGLFLQLRAPMLATAHGVLFVIGCGLVLRMAARQPEAGIRAFWIATGLRTWLTIPAVIALCVAGMILIRRARSLPAEGFLVSGAAPAEQLPRNASAFAHAVFGLYPTAIAAVVVLALLLFLTRRGARKEAGER